MAAGGVPDFDLNTKIAPGDTVFCDAEDLPVIPTKRVDPAVRE